MNSPKSSMLLPAIPSGSNDCRESRAKDFAAMNCIEDIGAPPVQHDAAIEDDKVGPDKDRGSFQGSSVDAAGPGTASGEFSCLTSHDSLDVHAKHQQL